LNSGDSVYLAANAIVEGRFLLAAGSSNITIRGRGILSMGEWTQTSINSTYLRERSTFFSAGTHRFVLEGLTLVNGTGWTVAIENWGGSHTHDNHYRNLKMVHWNGCTDGLWVTGDNNRADNCFIFNNDDAIVTKGGNNTRVSNIVFWGGRWGRFTLFYNTGTAVSNLTIENVDVIGKEGAPYLFLAEMKRRPIDMRDVTFRNIRIEERNVSGSYNKQRLFWLRSDYFAGTINNWLFENITLDRQLAEEGSFLASADHPYKDITFKNLRMGGRLILSPADSHIRFNEHVTGVRFLPAGP